MKKFNGLERYSKSGAVNLPELLPTAPRIYGIFKQGRQ